MTRRELLLPLVALCLAATSRAAERQDHRDLSHYLDDRGQHARITKPAEWGIRRRQILANFQSVAGPLPGPDATVPLDVRTDEEVRVGDLTRRKISIQTSGDQRVAAYLFLPPAPAGAKRPAVLCLHPTGAPGKQFAAGLTDKPNRSHALELAQRGYVTLAPDYPTFGDYPWELKAPWQSGTMRAIWDNVRCVDLLASLPEVDPDRVGAIGHSLGGHNAIFTAVFDPRIKAVVSSCGFTRFHTYKRGNLAGWTSPRYMPRIASEHANDPDRVPFDFPELIAALAPRAFFTSSPLRDDNFDVAGVRDTIAAAAPIYKLLGAPDNLQAIYPDCAHDFPDDARARAYTFLDKHLRPSPSR